MPGSAAQTFVSRPGQVVMAMFGGVFALLGAAGAAEGDVVLAVMGLGFGGYTIVRSLRSFSVTIEAEHVVTRSIVRTRRFPLSSLAHADVGVGQVSWSPSPREYVHLHFVDGGDFGFKDMTARASAGGGSPVRQAVDAICAAIDRRDP